ncbi:mechanosensitive ion channel family protein [Lentisphaera marina]|uniref:mechanosensitive ion channel family protein n=1 Tax=Lentisphaera marina TaxID=1111041 RepID=UPI0023655005|nr:mechanosensitive ion channel family protein [Lentisphaera marina]MDD7985521.1 mechanosensitive ion channel family protein [Lentisphaera marina]
MAEYVHIPIILFLACLLSHLCKRGFTALIDRGVKTLKIESTNYYFIRNGVSFVIYMVAFAIIFKRTPGLSGLGTTIFASAGIIAAAVGFAGKEAMSNIVSGIFIIMFKPFRVGDFLELDPQTRGKVEDITMRHTVLADINNRRILIPNSVISANAVVNFDISDEKIRYNFKVSVAYESDFELAMKIIKDYLENRDEVLSLQEPQADGTIPPKVNVFVSELGESGILLRADFWTEDFGKALEVSRDLNKYVLLSFRENDIEIPYPHRTVLNKQA